MRASTSIELKDRHTLQLTNFRGVDYSSSPLHVQTNRATDMRNWINEYGVNKKRNGWKELFKIELGGVPQRINGIFQYINRSHKELIVHAGTRFYRVTNDGDYAYKDITLSSTYPQAKCDISLLIDSRSQAFINKGKMYITGCGDYLVYGSWDEGETYELRRVYDNEDTYIPTTTISIDDDTITNDLRASLDDINLLSSRRINQLLGSGEANKTWTLDSGSIDADTLVEIKLETLVDGEAVTFEISNVGTDKTILYQGDTRVGTVDFANGKITFEMATTPQIENRDNIFVTFTKKTEGYAERITNCMFGILFGVNGNADRLFLSGNSDYPNVDFHSEMDDYTYFGDMNTSAMGSDASAVVGYARLSDSTLVIYKDYNGQEETIFYRTGTYQEYYDSDGNLESVRGLFPTTAGSIGESIVSRYAIANFVGDNIILSKNGVFGIVLSNNVATTERYTRERSRSINERLKRHADLSESVGIVYKSRYYLAIDNICYVADARYKYSSEDNAENSYNYEWWRWDNIPARVWANIDNELYFGSSGGQICVFDDQYTDRTYESTNEGDLSINIDDSLISFNRNIESEIKDNDSIKFLSEGIYALFKDNCEVENNAIKFADSEILSIYDGIEVYADNVGESGLQVGQKYIIYAVDKGNCTFKLTKEDGEVVDIHAGGFRLNHHLYNRELKIANIFNDSFQLKWDTQGLVLVLTKYNDSLPKYPIARLTHIANVIAEWYSPVFDLGTNESAKTLLKMSISTEPEVNGKVSFGYETKQANKLLSAQGINVFSFENLSFENFTFETAFASSYSVKCKERNFNFIIFRFLSDNEFNAAVNSMTVVYKINKTNKGVR